MSVRVYDRKLSWLQWQDPETKEMLTAWCAWDWSLFPSMQSLKADDIHFAILSAPIHLSSKRTTGSSQGLGLHEPPDLSENDYLFTQGDPDTGSGEALLRAARDYHTKHRRQLKRAHWAKERFRADKLAWEKANPPEPQDHTIWLKPHRGSRYLATTSNPKGGEQ